MAQGCGVLTALDHPANLLGRGSGASALSKRLNLRAPWSWPTTSNYPCSNDRSAGYLRQSRAHPDIAS